MSVYTKVKEGVYRLSNGYIVAKAYNLSDRTGDYVMCGWEVTDPQGNATSGIWWDTRDEARREAEAAAERKAQTGPVKSYRAEFVWTRAGHPISVMGIPADDLLTALDRAGTPRLWEVNYMESDADDVGCVIYEVTGASRSRVAVLTSLLDAIIMYDSALADQQGNRSPIGD